MISNLSTYLAKFRNLFIRLLLLAVGFVTIPEFCRLPVSDLDNSWVLGLYMAAARHLQFGTDVVFTFGPLGFLWQPVVAFPHLWLIAAVVTLVVHFVLIGLIASMLTRTSASIIHTLVIAVALLLTMSFVTLDYKLIITASILLYLDIAGKYNTIPGTIAAIVSACLLMATASLIKFSAAIMALAIVAIAMTILAFRRKVFSCALAGISFVAAAAVLWIVAGQRASSVVPFIRNSWQIASGYGGAMQLWSNGYYALLGFAVVICWVFLLAYTILKRQHNLWLFLLLNLGCIAMLFKHGFTRSDNDHIYWFFSHAMVLFSLILPIASTATTMARRICFSMTFVSLAAMSIAAMPRMWPATMMQMKSNYSLVASGLLGKCLNDPGAVIEQAKTQMRQSCGLKPETIKYIADSPMDVFSVMISVAYAYDFNWSCRPVFQSYSAYTSALDLMNARHIAAADGPRILIFAPYGIDDRFFAFDEPATMRAIAQYFEPVFVDAGFTVLKRKDRPSHATERMISSVHTELGGKIMVPKASPGANMYARINVDRTLVGWLWNILYKPPVMEIHLTSGDKNATCRLLPSNAGNGLQMSGIDNLVVVPQMKHFYSDQLNIEFFEVSVTPQRD